jgi:hypothetical protein
MISAKKTKIFLTVIGNVSYIRNEYFGFFVYNSKENKYMPHWSEKFRAAFKKNVHDILQGELRNLKADEKRQLLAILREHDDCPDGWKKKDPNKQKGILQCLYQAIARLVNPEKAKAANDRYYADPINKEKKTKYNHKYNARYNADPINKDKANARFRERYATDLKFRTMCILRARLRHALKNNKKDHTMDLLGCTVEQMVQHIESQFTPGMTWDNQGKGDDEWQIDHIIPFVAFDTSNRDEQFIVCWYQNTQPLWGPDNRSKGGKYTEEGKQSLICKYIEHEK